MEIKTLMVQAYKSENPQQYLMNKLILHKPSLTPMQNTIIDVVEMMSRIVPPPEAGSWLMDDLKAMVKHHSSQMSPVIKSIIQFIIFATQQCHFFGQVHDDSILMNIREPVICYSDYNVPCPYVWLDCDTRKRKRTLSMIKHSLTEQESVYPLLVVFDEVLLSFDLQTFACMPSASMGHISLASSDKGDSIRCIMGAVPREAIVQPRQVEFTLVLSCNMCFCQCVLLHVNGRKTIKNGIIHPSYKLNELHYKHITTVVV